MERNSHVLFHSLRSTKHENNEEMSRRKRQICILISRAVGGPLKIGSLIPLVTSSATNDPGKKPKNPGKMRVGGEKTQKGKKTMNNPKENQAKS